MAADLPTHPPVPSRGQLTNASLNLGGYRPSPEEVDRDQRSHVVDNILFSEEPTPPQAPPRGQLRRDADLLIASMHLCYSMKKNDIRADQVRLDEKVCALMSQAHIMVLTGINPYWMSYLRFVLPGIAASQDRGDWDFRYDKEEVCILWAVETCRLHYAEV